MPTNQTTTIPKVPERSRMWDGPGDADLGDLERVWIYFFQRIARGNGNPDAAGGGPFLRTLGIQDTTVRSDAAPHVIIHTGGSIVLIAGVLRKAIAADLTVRLNIYTPTGSTEIGTFTIPASTPINLAVPFTSLVTDEFNDLDIVGGDITASDGSADPDGIATFSIWWGPT